MAVLDKDFFIDNKVLFIGYSGKEQFFSKMVYEAFSRNGIKVYPVNKKDNGSYDVKVYKSMDELPEIPATAYILLKPDNARSVIKELSERGIKRVLFHSGKTKNNVIVGECEKLGMEAIAACPMMKFGSVLHRIHGFFAGVK